MEPRKTQQEEFREAIWKLLAIFRDWFIFAFMLWIAVPPLFNLFLFPINPGFFDCLAFVITLRTCALIITR